MNVIFDHEELELYVPEPIYTDECEVHRLDGYRYVNGRRDAVIDGVVSFDIKLSGPDSDFTFSLLASVVGGEKVHLEEYPEGEAARKMAVKSVIKLYSGQYSQFLKNQSSGSFFPYESVHA